MSANCRRSDLAKKGSGKVDVVGVAILIGLVAAVVVFFAFLAGKGTRSQQSARLTFSSGSPVTSYLK